MRDICRAPQEPLQAELALEPRRPVHGVRLVLVRYPPLFGPADGVLVVSRPQQCHSTGDTASSRLGWVDFVFGYSTFCPILVGQVEVGKNC